MAQPDISSCTEIQTYGLPGRDQTQCIKKDTTQLDNSGRSSLKAKGIEEVCDGGQTHCNSPANSWLIQIKKKLDYPDKMWQVSEKVCIYRVPKPILISNPKAYDPFVVAFGPYHNEANSELSRMDENKLQAIIRMSTRLKINFNTLISEVRELEMETRYCYAESIALDGEALSWMLTMDACFILEFFGGKKDTDSDRFSLIFEHLGKDNSALIAITDDIMKLENQIPLCILIKLLQKKSGSREVAIVSLVKMIDRHNVFLGHPFQFSRTDDAEPKLQKHIGKEPPPHHLLDLYRMVIVDLLASSIVNSATSVESDANGSAGKINSYHGRCGQLMNVKLTLMQRLRFPDGCGGAQNNINWHRWCGWWTNVRLLSWMQRLSCKKIPLHRCQRRSVDHTRYTPSAELLHKAGIKFKPGQFRFEKKWLRPSTLFIPEISVDDRTERLLRNLMAYEECRLCSRPPEANTISHFVRVLDDLIDSERDVSLLRKSLIIKSYVGSDEEIARMFNRLSDGITFGTVDAFDKVMKEARDHYRSQWTVWISEFKQQHCSKPWYVISLVAAILILAMTAVQTVFSVKK